MSWQPGECPEWQRELTVNQPPHGFAGSSPASPTKTDFAARNLQDRAAEITRKRPLRLSGNGTILRAWWTTRSRAKLCGRDDDQHADAESYRRTHAVGCLKGEISERKWRIHVQALFDEVDVSVIHNLVVDHLVTFDDLLKPLDTWQVTGSENERWVREMASFAVKDLMQNALAALDSLEDGPGRWTFGGGTALAQIIDHRIFYDVDIFLDSRSVLKQRAPNINPVTKSVCDTSQRQGKYLKLILRDVGEIGFSECSVVHRRSDLPAEFR